MPPAHVHAHRARHAGFVLLRDEHTLRSLSASRNTTSITYVHHTTLPAVHASLSTTQASIGHQYLAFKLTYLTIGGQVPYLTSSLG